ncbi:hypothetical protein RYX36_014849, partial [Vicia faba]
MSLRQPQTKFSEKQKGKIKESSASPLPPIQKKMQEQRFKRANNHMMQGFPELQIQARSLKHPVRIYLSSARRFAIWSMMTSSR